ncbi:MAG TPA: PIN domain-containing protein [Steroidobacteraceae bacterium]|nr:PIN domain-containing protein [Steroidobacteraceae bacterium]
MNRVLVDTSVWVAHFRFANPVLQSLLSTDQVLCHPLIVIELACGTPPAPRARTLEHLKKLQQSVIATPDEILSLIESKRCYDTGCGATDVALLASALLTADSRLWTMDKDLAQLAVRLGVAFEAEGIAPPA